MRRAAVTVAVGLVLWAGPAAAQRRAAPAATSPAELAAAVTRATQHYRDVLARSVPIHEAQVREAVEVVRERRQLHVIGALSAEAVEQAERALGAAQRDLDETLTAIDEADRLLFEAMVQERIARLAPLPRGGYEDTAALVRFNGTSPWSLKNVPKLDQQFAGVFGRPLPISSFGQTAVHDRLGFDHRAAIDVAVHPDSAEGRWLIEHLRASGIPFIGVRATVPGASTGAHIHIGPPSGRLLAR
ncbi:MAG TPA: hypothetical protein VFV05_20670 [Methylomirabilota bacterium]|nr:hypothetical protein [Methylomirabilota bacterium]